MVLDLIIILRLAQALLSLVALGLNASVTHFFNSHQFHRGPPNYLAFLVFTSTWTLLVSIPYTTFAPPYFPAYINRWASLAFELLTTLFWFAGSIAGAVHLASLDVCRGLMCHNARAGVVFAALVWLCFCVTSYFPVKYCFFEGDREIGAQNWRLGVSGAERITRVRMRREKDNLVDVRAARVGDDVAAAAANGGGQSGFAAKILRGAREVMEVARVRARNVAAEWKTKAGKEADADGAAEMRQRGREPGNEQAVMAGSMGSSRGHAYRSRSVTPQGGHMV